MPERKWPHGTGYGGVKKPGRNSGRGYFFELHFDKYKRENIWNEIYEKGKEGFFRVFVCDNVYLHYFYRWIMIRIAAAAIDFAITMSVPLFILLFAEMPDWLFFVMTAAINLLYFGTADYFHGGYSLGKRWLDLYVSLQKSDKNSILRACLIHSFAKAAISFCWPLGLLIYVICDNKMPYDKIVYKQICDD